MFYLFFSPITKHNKFLDCMNKWTKSVFENYFYRKEKNQRHFTSQIQAGLSLCALVDQLNTALQGLLSLMFINCASESILCIYFASSTAIYNNNYKMAPVSLKVKVKSNYKVVFGNMTALNYRLIKSLSSLTVLNIQMGISMCLLYD